jgi:hypothetical protein
MEHHLAWSPPLPLYVHPANKLDPGVQVKAMLVDSRLWMVFAMVQCKISSPKRTQVLGMDISRSRSSPSF